MITKREFSDEEIYYIARGGATSYELARDLLQARAERDAALADRVPFAEAFAAGVIKERDEALARVKELNDGPMYLVNEDGTRTWLEGKRIAENEQLRQALDVLRKPEVWGHAYDATWIVNYLRAALEGKDNE